MGTAIEPISAINPCRNDVNQHRYYFYSKQVADHIRITYGKRTGTHNQPPVREQKPQKRFVSENPNQPGSRIDIYI